MQFWKKYKKFLIQVLNGKKIQFLNKKCNVLAKGFILKWKMEF